MTEKEFNEIKSHITRYIIEQYNFDYKERVTPDEIIDLIKPFVKPPPRFEVGDRIRVYDIRDTFTGTISLISSTGMINVIEDGFSFTHYSHFHPKQCRKLKKKNAKTSEK